MDAKRELRPARANEEAVAQLTGHACPEAARRGARSRQSTMDRATLVLGVCFFPDGHGSVACRRRRGGSERPSEHHASAAAPTWCIVMAAATAGEMRGERCANVSSAGVASQVVLHCSVLRTLVRRIEARTLHSSHVRTCLSSSGINLEHCRTQSRRRQNVLSNVLSDVLCLPS